ncbi:hypothetical protein CEXT_305601 [Caerostris extrusa]|uniref:Uncharacterized protein n=1 Tax=Caerostris extrusa TaxID=172846 RepID=A0AAV4XJ62_CAEEX|nr:hypothetical protein CEXT_305601 [Caerostris extrusa]
MAAKASGNKKKNKRACLFFINSLPGSRSLDFFVEGRSCHPFTLLPIHCQPLCDFIACSSTLRGHTKCSVNAQNDKSKSGFVAPTRIINDEQENQNNFRAWNAYCKMAAKASANAHSRLESHSNSLDESSPVIGWKIRPSTSVSLVRTRPLITLHRGGGREPFNHPFGSREHTSLEALLEPSDSSFLMPLLNK